MHLPWFSSLETKLQMLSVAVDPKKASFAKPSTKNYVQSSPV